MSTQIKPGHWQTKAIDLYNATMDTLMDILEQNQPQGGIVFDIRSNILSAREYPEIKVDGQVYKAKVLKIALGVDKKPFISVLLDNGKENSTRITDIESLGLVTDIAAKVQAEYIGQQQMF